MIKWSLCIKSMEGMEIETTKYKVLYSGFYLQSQ